METVLDVLKAMEKASAREIAARMKIEPRDALEMLNEQQEIGTVAFLNGYWLLSGIAPARTKTVKCGTLKPEASKEMTVKIGEQQLTDAIRENGPLTAEDLATMFGITSRKVTSTLAMATGRGRLTRINRDGKYWYCLPEQVLPEPNAASAPDPVPDTDNASTAETAIATVSDNAESAPEGVVVEEPAAVIDESEVPEALEEVSDSTSAETETVIDTPLADAQPAAHALDVMELPSPRTVAKNLRRHKAQLARLQKAHSAVQAVRRYGLQVTPAPKEIVREIRRLTAIVEAGTKLSGAVSMAKKYLARINRYEN
ncbi:DUF1627 domain-containing protein [Salmonella enterica]|uniref:DUF1627 domain-containing protein n=1 Tax=Salmonella enterica TaxID=28901 RepID=UPI0036D63FBB